MHAPTEILALVSALRTEQRAAHRQLEERAALAPELGERTRAERAAYVVRQNVDVLDLLVRAARRAKLDAYDLARMSGHLRDEAEEELARLWDGGALRAHLDHRFDLAHKLLELADELDA